MLNSIVLLALAFNVFRSNALRITYPQSGDLVNVYHGLTTTWTYNSSDSIFLPLLIQYVEASHMEEAVQHIDKNINITLGSFTIETTFGLAESYFLRFIYGNDYYESGHFDITLTEQSSHDSNTSSTITSPVQPTTFTSSAILPTTTESTNTGGSSPGHVVNGSSSPEAPATSTVTEIPINPNTNSKSGGGLSRDARVGIGIGCSVAGIIGAAGLFLFYRRTKNKLVPEQPPNLRNADPVEMELEGCRPAPKIFEIDGKHDAANLPELPSHPI